MKSRRLHGVHRLIDWLLVQINLGNHRQRMTQLKTNQNPIFKSRTQFIFTLTQGSPKCYYSLARRNPSGKCSIFQFVIDSAGHKLVHIFSKDKPNCHRIPPVFVLFVE